MTTSSSNDLNSTINTIYVEIEKFLNLNAQTHAVSTASSNDVLNLVKTKQDSERLKHILRTSNWSPVHPIRKGLWSGLLNPVNNRANLATSTVNNKENNSSSNKNLDETEYSTYLNQIFGKNRDLNVSLPEFVLCNETTVTLNNYATSNSNLTTSNSSNSSANAHLNYYYLNSKGKEAIKRILCVYEYRFPQVTYSPGLVSLSSILLHYMKEHEVFAALCYLSSTKDHLIETKTSWESACAVFINLIKIYCKSSYEIISKYATESLDKIFNDWYWWIFDSLSFNYLVKIIDCYLVEGQKVLYRISLAIVQQFSKYLRNEKLNINKNSIKSFCNSVLSTEPVEKLIKASFSIRNFKRATIKELFLKEEAKRKSVGTPVMTARKQNVDDNNNSTPLRIFLKETNTGILTHEQLTTIWNWIPPRLSVFQPNLLFTTRENGTSVNTLFGVLNDLEYSLIIIKTFQNEIFGAFCSGLWEERKNKATYFGNGETFLFTLCPNKIQYKWVGFKQQKPLPNQELFLRVDKNKIAIGGGGHDGLAIHSNLLEGSTNKCDTFENEALASTTMFQIETLEAIGFKN